MFDIVYVILSTNSLVTFGEWNLPLNYMLCILPLCQWLVLEMSHHANISTAIGKEMKKNTNIQPLTYS